MTDTTLPCYCPNPEQRDDGICKSCLGKISEKKLKKPKAFLGGYLETKKKDEVKS